MVSYCFTKLLLSHVLVSERKLLTWLDGLWPWISIRLYTKVRVVKQEKSADVQIIFQEVGLGQILPIKELQALKTSLGSSFSFEQLDNSEGIDIDLNVSKLLDDYVLLKNGFAGKLRSAFEATFKAFLFIYLASFDKLEPLNLTVETELPVGAGLGSSASFAVALAGGLLASAGRVNHDALDTDLINRWAFVSEKFVHGNPSGIDNTVATLGGAVVYHGYMVIICLLILCWVVCKTVKTQDE